MFETDQAAGLRRIFARKPLRVIALAGDCKEKASVAGSLAVSFSDGGPGVMIIDGSAGEVAASLGLACRYELAHVIAGDKTLEKTLLQGPRQIAVLPAARGLDRLASLTDIEARRVRDAFMALEYPISTLIVNAAPFQTDSALNIFQGDTTVAIVVSDAVSSITAAYSEMKALQGARNINEFDLIIGGAPTNERAAAIYRTLADAAKQYLSVNLNYRGAASANISDFLAGESPRIGNEIHPGFAKKGSAMVTKGRNYVAAC